MKKNKPIMLTVFFLFAVFGAVFATGECDGREGMDALTCQLGCFCADLMSIMPILAMLMLVLAGVIYAGGQMMGSETRAHANVWATACLTGALIGILIVVIAPTIILTLMPGVPAGTDPMTMCSCPPTFTLSP